MHPTKLSPRSKALLAMKDRGAYMKQAHSKKEAYTYYKAKKDKKKLPTFHREYKGHKDPEFAKMSIEDYEQKYG